VCLVNRRNQERPAIAHLLPHGITSDIEVIPIQKVNEAYERVQKSDVRYRFVIDIASLKDKR
jgi:D-arabinose 1-dehydrogenase-like Zn-dependent alcohol dehydrogenase